ncbi:MAG: DUF4135 domain-containing protein [Rothia sp. (in: high G+C Gram-positive bacteria)]|nr:DUF4135 domain-containing protein [Rothia sp. (in: high G+C Gram-positive bacteria)]
MFDFHHWRNERGYAADRLSHEALDKYKESWDGIEEYVAHLNGKFPQLQTLSESLVERTASFAEEVLSHWCEDQQDLIQAGLVPPSSEIVGWEFLFEESHHGGRGTVAVEWQNKTDGGTLIYKPRVSDGESLLGFVFSMVANEGEKFTPKALTCGQHSWHEYIPRETISDSELYLQRCGKVLAVCSLLGTTDLHADNIRPGPNNCPVIVDGETAVQLRPSMDGALGSWELFSSGLVPTTMGAALLVAFGGLSGDQGLGPSLEQPYMSFALSDPDTDAVSVRRTTETLRVASLGSGQTHIDTEVRRQLIVKGFREAVSRLRDTEDLYGKITGQVFGKTFRQVVRGTNVYFALLTAATDPGCLAGQSPSPFHLLMQKNQDTDSLAATVSGSEVRQLTEGDVPYFNLYVDSTGDCFIRDNDELNTNTRSLNYRDGLNLSGRIEWILGLREEQIRSALNINDCTLGLQSRSPKINDLRQYLLETRSDELSQWLWVDSTSPERLRLVTGGVSFLGSLGTSYAVGSVASVLDSMGNRANTAKLRWHTWGPAASGCLIDGFKSGRHRQWRTDLPELLRMRSSGDYLTGLLGFIAQVPEEWRSSAVDRLVSDANVEENDGLAHGKAGLLAAAASAGHELAPQLGVELAERLSVAKNFEELAWCRGSTGIVAALAASHFLSKNQADDYVESVIRVLSEVLALPAPIDFSFCHGLAGIIGVLDLLHTCGHKVAGAQADSLRDTVFSRLERGEGYFLALPGIKEDPGFLNGYGSLLLLRNPAAVHPLLPRIQKAAVHALG